jgi:hypothetical protein
MNFFQNLISILESPSRHGDKVDDGLRVVSLRPVVLDVDVALTLRQLRAVLVHDQRQVSVSLKILKFLLKKNLLLKFEFGIEKKRLKIEISFAVDIVVVVAIAVAVVVGNVGF